VPFGRKCKVNPSAIQGPGKVFDATSRHSPFTDTSPIAGNEVESSMKIVVIGGSGLIGTSLVNRLRKKGHEVLAASPA
jgi:hypothetical protein